MCPIWCSSLLIDGPLLGFCVWSNISSLSGPSGNSIQTNKNSPQSLGLGVQMKKIISAEILCICDRNQTFNKFTKLKLKPQMKKLTCLLIWKRMLSHVCTKLVLFKKYLFLCFFMSKIKEVSHPKTELFKKCSPEWKHRKTTGVTIVTKPLINVVRQLCMCKIIVLFF